MTKRQRDQVVELLRCAGDLALHHPDPKCALGNAASWTGNYCLDGIAAACNGDGHWTQLLRLVAATKSGEVCGAGYEWALLEAAQRVEDGDYPPTARKVSR